MRGGSEEGGGRVFHEGLLALFWPSHRNTYLTPINPDISLDTLNMPPSCPSHLLHPPCSGIQPALCSHNIRWVLHKQLR